MKPTTDQLNARKKAFFSFLIIAALGSMTLNWLQYASGQALKDRLEKQQKSRSELKLLNALSLAVLCIDAIKPNAHPEQAKHATSRCDAAKAEYDPALKAYENGPNYDARLKGIAW